MAFTSGTATDYHDLLDKLRLYLVAQGWTELNWDAPAGLTDTATLQVRGPGAGADKQVFINIQTTYRGSDNSYAWQLRGAIGYEPGADWGTQPGESPQVFYNLWPNSIDYWFYVNDRRFIVIAKIGIVYIPMYAGFFLPFATPAEYPFPLYVAGNMSELQVYNYGQAHNRFFVDPGINSAYYRRRLDGTWGALRNHGTGIELDNVFSEESIHMWPHRCGRADGRDDLGYWENIWLQNMRPNLSGELPMFTPHVIDTQRRLMAGALDGTYITGGFNRVPEQTVTLGSRTFRLFPNVFRSRPRDFMAIEEIA